MKITIILTAKALTLVPASAARAATTRVELGEPLALGLDVGTTVSSALVGAIAGSVCFELPLAHPMSLTFQPSAYWASGTGVSVLQLTMVVMMRFYPVALFVEGQAHWGPFVAAGAAVAWAREQADVTTEVVAFGPEVEGGYRLVFGDRGVFLEPSFGWTSFYGGQFDSSGVSATTNSGFSIGCIVGYRF